jgi:hypothetical protein
MWCLIDLLFGRPVAAAISSLQMLGEDIPTAIKVDAVISRAAHILSRPVAGRCGSARLTFDTRAGAEQTKDRTI